MRNLICLLIIAASISSCKKDKDVTPQPKTFLVSRATTVSGSNTTVMRYNRSGDGRLLSYIGPAEVDSVALTYDARGRIATLRFTRFGQNGYDYAYDDQGRVTSAQGYNNDGSKGTISTYTYYDDRIEELLLYTTNQTNKKIYTYTADKKNIANFKWIGTSGNLAEEESYTYTDIKSSRYGYEEIRPQTSENAVEKTIRITYTGGVAGAPVTFSRKITVNSDGYPASIENTSSNSVAVSTTTYEYIGR